MDTIVREKTEIELHPSNVNVEVLSDPVIETPHLLLET
jgi:hypothetical protein